MDVPGARLVRPHESDHDSSNIRLASFDGIDQVMGVEVIFNLVYLRRHGH